MLRRVLLAYARFNKSTGYCQGFNIIAAMILKVVHFNERLALKVRVEVENGFPLRECELNVGSVVSSTECWIGSRL